MTFSKYLDESWNLHAADSRKVAESFSSGLNLVTTAEEMSDMIHLISHVFGEHLGEWQRGIDLLESLKTYPLNLNSEKNLAQIQKSIRIYKLADHQFPEILQLPKADQAAIHAGAAKGYAGLHNAETSKLFLLHALELMDSTNDPKSSAHRDLAIAGNQIAVAFEEKSALSQIEKDYMIFAAQIARKHWEIAGTWMNVERAEYRFAKVFIKTNQSQQALNHALACIEICQKNSAPDLEFFFGYEVVAESQQIAKNLSGFSQAIEKMREHFDKLSEADKQWTEKT